MARTRMLSPEIIQHLVQEYMDNILELDREDRYRIVKSQEDEIWLKQGQAFHDRYHMDARKDYDMINECGEEVTVSGAENLASFYQTLANRCHRQIQRQEYNEIGPYAVALLGIEGLQCNQALFSMLCDGLLAKEAEANEVLALRAQRGLNNEYDREHPPIWKKRLTLSTLMKKYITLHGDTGGRHKSKLDEHFGKVLDVIGNPLTEQLTQDMMIDLFDGLAKYPKYRNHEHMKGLTLEECYAHPKYEPIDLTTLKGIWFTLGGLLTYACERKDYGIVRNFCNDTVFTIKKKLIKRLQSPKFERLPYSPPNVQNLVIQTGQRCRPIHEPQKFWIPLIAVYNGMREGEICQLFCDDIIVVDKIDCFRIRPCPERYQSVKNVQSQRTIPVHPTLIERGFMDFVKSRRKLNYDRPWQGMKSRKIEYYKPLDTYAHDFEKWYNGTFRKYVILDVEERKHKPFHSLRHTFINWFFQNLKFNELDFAAIKGLVGHLESDELKVIHSALKGITWEVYSQELNPKRMLETLERLDYGIDLSPLGRQKW